MKSFTLLTAITSVSAVSVRFPNLKPKAEASAVDTLTGIGSAIPPWQEGYSPSWYLGDNPDNAPDLPWLKNRTLCTTINKIPDSVHCPGFPLSLVVRAHLASSSNKARSPTTDPDPTSPAPATPSQNPPPPPPPGVYNPIFTNLDGAIEADDYLTFGLVDTVEDCQKMCDNVQGCGFFNTYHDVNGKDGSPLLTCSLYRSCHGADQAINKGGQTQPDGSLNFIRSSDGYCRQN